MNTMIERRYAVELDGPLPGGWSTLEGAERDAGADIELAGGPGTEGIRPRLVIVTEKADTDKLAEAAAQVRGALERDRPGVLVANIEAWPHPVWGEGRFLQSARVEDGVTLAHDIYLFLDGDREIRVHVLCALVDLLALEEQVATIVARLRPRAEVAR